MNVRHLVKYDILDLFAAELLAAAVNRVFNSAHDDKAVAALMHARNVARSIIAVSSDCPLVMLRLVVIAANSVRPSEDYLARDAGLALIIKRASEITVLIVIALGYYSARIRV